MARTGITKDQVFEAAREIRDEGGTVTIAAVRSRLGGTGSYSTYSRHLAEWRKQESSENHAPPTPASVEAIARRLWSEAWRLASESLENASRQWEKEKKHLEFELHNLAIELDQSKQAFNEAMDKLQSTMKGLMEKTLAFEHLKDDHEKLKKIHEATLNRVGKLERDNAALLQKLDSAVRDITRLENELAESRAQERRALKEAAALRGQLESVEKTKVRPLRRKKS